MQLHTDLPLFAWQPPCRLIAFPMVNRVGKIRDVAGKMLDKTTDRHADHYRSQVNEALVKQFEKIGLAENEIEQQLAGFWLKVGDEMTRLTYQGHGTGGNAA